MTRKLKIYTRKFVRLWRVQSNSSNQLESGEIYANMITLRARLTQHSGLLNDVPFSQSFHNAGVNENMHVKFNYKILTQ